MGGGTVGDLSTVAAHLLKRGVKLIHMPTTLLAAVDSSQGGKGALDVHAGRHPVKNAAGVFHYPFECWLGEELFTSLSAAQLREGGIEAWKMVACLDAALWSRYRAAPPPLPQLVRDARRLKADVCEKDPYEQGGLRRVLNFGHTFGHVLESLSGLALAHGDAVGLGIYCALDVGRRVGVTSDPLAREVERGFEEGPGLLGRDGLAKALGRWAAPRLAELLGADKKATRAGELQMVLLAQLGAAVVQAVPAQAWRSLLEAWRSGARP